MNSDTCHSTRALPAPGGAMRSATMIMDAPWAVHTPKLLLWGAIQGLVIATGIIMSNDLPNMYRNAQVLPFPHLTHTCMLATHACTHTQWHTHTALVSLCDAAMFSVGLSVDHDSACSERQMTGTEPMQC